ncbi:MAG: twin-arginine translocase TatA/TatE family subunit [Acidimicrobiia bacterium]
MFGFIKNIGGPELIVILVVVLLLFGAAKLPQLARSIGASAKEFRKGLEEGVDESAEDQENQEDSSV